MTIEYEFNEFQSVSMLELICIEYIEYVWNMYRLQSPKCTCKTSDWRRVAPFSLLQTKKFSGNKMLRSWQRKSTKPVDIRMLMSAYSPQLYPTTIRSSPDLHASRKMQDEL